MTIFATLTPIDLGTNTRVTVRVCASQDVESTGAAGERWWPAMVTLPVIQARFFDGDFTSSVEPPTASIDLRLDVLIASGAFPGVERYDWAGASCRLQRLSGGSLVDVQLMQVESFASEAMVLGLRLRAASELYDAEVLRARYAGTTGAEGGADLRGQLKPWVFGRALNVEPVFIDQINNVFQVSGYGPVQAIAAVYERGGSFGASVGDFPNYAALVAATIPPGRWGTCLAQGMFRLGAPPAGVITCDVDGDNTGGFLRRTGAILSEIATRIGLVDKVSAASIAALDAAVARNVNIVIREQTSFIELAQRMLAPCNAVASVGSDGRLIASRVSFGAEQFTLDAQGRQMPPVLNMARQNTSAPYKRVQMGAARSWRVHTFDEIAFYSELIDRGLYAGATVYREGNIVESADKSRWVYINPTPSSGNAPPTWPTASNAFWANIAPPLAPEAIGLEPGATRNTGALNADGLNAVDAGGPLLIGQLPTDKAAPGLQNALVPLGNSNRVPLSRMEGNSGYGVPFNGSGLAGATDYGLFEGMRFFRFQAAATAANQTVSVGHLPSNVATFRLTPNERVSVQARVEVAGSGAAGGIWRIALWGFVAGGSQSVIGEVFGAAARSIGNGFVQFFVDVPSTVIGGRLEIYGTSGGAGLLQVALSEPMVTSAAPGQTVHPPFSPGPNSEDGGDITRTVSGPADLVMQFRADLSVTSPLPLTADYRLGLAGATPLTSGVSWSVAVLSGTFAGAAPTIVGSGTAQLRINSTMTSPEAELRITASVAGRASPPFIVMLRRQVAPPTNAAFTFINSDTFAIAHSQPLQVQLPSGVSSVSLTAVADLLVNPEIPQGGTFVEGKWQRESSPGTWVDVGGVATSSPSPEVFFEEPFPGEFFYSAAPGSITCNRTASGLTPGTIQRFRFVARISLGNVRDVRFNGNGSAVA